MRKGQLVLWAALTFAVGWVSYALAMPAFNRAKVSSDPVRAFEFVLLPLFVQILWLGAAAAYSSRSKRREPILGTLLGFGLEFLALVILVVFSASSRH